MNKSPIDYILPPYLPRGKGAQSYYDTLRDAIFGTGKSGQSLADLAARKAFKAAANQAASYAKSKMNSRRASKPAAKQQSAPPPTISVKSTKVADLSAPVAVSQAYSSNYVRKIGRPQLNIDYDPADAKDCARFEFSVITNWYIVPNDPAGKGLSWWKLGTTLPVLANTQPVFFVTPTNLSTKLANYEKIYQRYAFRELDVCLVTNQATSSVGQYGVSYVNSLSSLTNAGVGVAAQSLSVVMDYDPAVVSPLWSNQCFKAQHKGCRTWSSVYLTGGGALTPYVPVSGPVGAQNQFYGCVQSGLMTAGNCPVDANQNPIALLMVKGVVDFYSTQPVTTGNPSLSRIPYERLLNYHLKVESERSETLRRRDAALVEAMFDEDEEKKEGPKAQNMAECKSHDDARCKALHERAILEGSNFLCLDCGREHHHSSDDDFSELPRPTMQRAPSARAVVRK